MSRYWIHSLMILRKLDLLISKPVEFFAKSVEYLSKADKAYFAEGWENTRGCSLEHLICENYNIEIIND